MKGVITIFALPQEMEDLGLTLERVKRNAVHLDKSIHYRIEVTMCLSDQLTDWSSTKLPKDYIRERTTELFNQLASWSASRELRFEEGDYILGCVSQRRHSLEKNPDADFFIWLDCDMFFSDTTLHYLTEGYRMHTDEMSIVTPQFVRQWDTTWDVIMNDKYKGSPINYHLDADIYNEVLTPIADLEIDRINDFKFAGGWCTLIAGKLLRTIGIPKSFGHYGLEDTFVMICCHAMIQLGAGQPAQYIIKNMIAGETHKHRTNKTVKRWIHSIDRKGQYRNIAESNFKKEFDEFVKRITT